MGKIVGFGALNLDLIYEVKDLKSISLREGPLVPGREIFGPEEEFRSLLEQLNQFGTLKSKSGGGSAANTIVALARMGFPTEFIGKVGGDKEGDFILENMKPAPINSIRRDDRSGICLVVLDRNQDRFLFVRGNTNNTLTAEEINLNALRDISWIHLTSFIGEIPFETQKVLLNRLDSSVKVSLDPGEIYAKKGLIEILPLLKRSDILFLTEREIRMLTQQELHASVKSLMKAGPSVLISKRGSQGSHVFTKEGDFEVPAVRVEVVDNTGAGDVYNAGFLAGLWRRALFLQPLLRQGVSWDMGGIVIQRKKI